MMLWEESIWSNSTFPKGQPQCFHLDSEIEITCFNVDGKTKQNKKKRGVVKTPLCWPSKKSDSSSGPTTK